MQAAKQEDREQHDGRDGESQIASRPREVNVLRIIGGLLLMVALLLYFFHLAEAPMGRSTLGVLAALFAVSRRSADWVGSRRLRHCANNSDEQLSCSA